MKLIIKWTALICLLAAALLCLGRFTGSGAGPVGESAMVSMLELVNKTHAASGEPKDLATAYPAVQVRESSIRLHPQALAALQEMFEGAQQAGVKGLYLSSGYRSYEEQKQVYAEAADKDYAQPPGCSEHQTGLAADILALNVKQNKMASSAQGRWLAKNAWRYGFILRYPEGKESITGIAYEPWHFRYIGLPHAKYCYENKLCLEEYLLLLAQEDGVGSYTNLR